MDLYDELLGLIDAFERTNVDYAICGGIAVAFHGYVRFTKDIDLLVAERDLTAALEAAEKQGFEFRTSPLRFAANTPQECIVHRVSKIEGAEQLVLDVVVVTPVLRDVWSSRSLFEWSDRKIKVVSVDGLALMKRLAGRERDLLDLKELGLSDDGAEEEQTDPAD